MSNKQVSVNELDENQRWLEYDIRMARYNYFRSYERQKLAKQREKAFWLIALALFAAIILILVLSVLLEPVDLRKFNEWMENGYHFLKVLLVGLPQIAVPFIASRLIYREKPWPYIYVKYNPKAVEAAAKAGIELIPPEKPKPVLTPQAATEYLAEIKRLLEISYLLSVALHLAIMVIAVAPFFLFFKQIMEVVEHSEHPFLLTGLYYGGFFSALSVLPRLIDYFIARWSRIEQ